MKMKPNLSIDGTKQKSKKFWDDFRKFAFKGNIVDLALAVVIGGAFGKIVSSLVNDIIMPLVGMMIGNIDFKDLKFTIPTVVEGVKGATLTYGMFIQNVIDFMLVALSMFLVIKLFAKFQQKKEEEPAAPPAPAEPSNEEKLLMEIRDLLKEKK